MKDNAMIAIIRRYGVSEWVCVCVCITLLHRLYYIFIIACIAALSDQSAQSYCNDWFVAWIINRRASANDVKCYLQDNRPLQTDHQHGIIRGNTTTTTTTTSTPLGASSKDERVKNYYRMARLNLL